MIRGGEKPRRWHTTASDVLITISGICLALSLARGTFPIAMPYEACVVVALFVFGGSVGVLSRSRARGVREAFVIGGIRFIFMCCVFGFFLPAVPDEVNSRE